MLLYYCFFFLCEKYYWKLLLQLKVLCTNTGTNAEIEIVCLLFFNRKFHISYKVRDRARPLLVHPFAVPKLCRLNYLLTHIFVSAMVNVQRVSARTRSHECVHSHSCLLIHTHAQHVNANWRSVNTSPNKAIFAFCTHTL